MEKIIPLIISILIHLAIMLVVINTPAPKKQKKDQKIFVQLIEAPKPKIEKKKKLVFENQAQETEKPEKADFYGEKNAKVKKQTVAKNKNQIPQKRAQRKNKGQKKKKLTLADLRPNSYTPESMVVKEEKIEEKKEQPYQDGNLLNLADFKDKVEEGGENLLNTQELVYYSFYNRIRTMLVPRWLGLFDEYKYSKGLYVAKGTSIQSEVTFKINKEGNLIGRELTKSSGHSPADEMAMEAFSTLETLPNPPKGIFQGKEYLYITWGFTIFRN